MPKRTPTDKQLDALIRELAPALRDPWKRSARGNLWRRWMDKSLSVFRRVDGLYGYCVAARGGPVFSSDAYRTEDEAIEALVREVGLEDELDD